MTTEPLNLAAAFAIGLAIAALYHAALWVAVRRLPRARHPSLWLLGGAAVRIALLLVAWYWIADGRWQVLLACLFAFVVVRMVATRWVRTGAKLPIPS